MEHDLDASKIRSNTFTLEWPPKSGKHQEFPEIDRGDWFDFVTSKFKLSGNQATLVDELAEKLKQLNQNQA